MALHWIAVKHNSSYFNKLRQLVVLVLVNRCLPTYDKLFLQVGDNHLVGTNLESLLLGSLEVLLLSDICEEADNLIALLYTESSETLVFLRRSEGYSPRSHLRMQEVSSPPLYARHTFSFAMMKILCVDVGGKYSMNGMEDRSKETVDIE